MVDMEKREKLVAALTRRHMIRSGSSSSSPIDSNRNETEGGDHNPAFRQKKGKAKALKWRVSNTDMNSKRETGGSDGDYDDTVLSSLTTDSFSRKRVKTLRKVADHCASVDPPVPRKLRSAINKRAGQTVSTSMRHVKKRRHLSAISAQTFLMDQRCDEISLANHFSKEEEVVVDALLSLSQIPPLRELSSERTMAEDSLDKNVASASYSAGAIKEDEKITTSALPTAGNEVTNQTALKDEPLERTGHVPQKNLVPVGATCNNINPVLSKDGQRHDISMGIVTNLPSPSKDYNNSSRKQLKVQFDDSTTYPEKLEAPRCLVNSKKPDLLEHDGKNVKNNTAQEIAPLVQTSLPCTSHGPSASTLAARNYTATETAKGTGKHENLSLLKNGVSSKTRKRSITHVYTCHLIQMHLNKEKASQNQVKPEEISHSHISSSPNGPTISKNGAQDDKFYAVHFDVRLPVQPSSGICNASTARQKMVSGNFLNLPTSAALSGAHHVQYLHPQIAPRGAMPYPIQHLPYSRGNLAPSAVLQQMPQYMCNPSLPTSSAIMKIQQLMPNQQQQQMWQFHFPQYQPRPDAAAVSAAWHQNSRLQDMSSLRPVAVLPPPPPQMELFCAPYQGGGSRQLPQLRLI